MEGSESTAAPQQPQQPSPFSVTDDDASDRRGIPAGRLNAFFVCPYCQGYFRDPHVATCCLSTFCRDCVVRVLRTAASACPSCGQYMGVTLPQRTRPDPQLQAVMLKLLPDIFEQERAREAAFWRDRAASGEEQALFPEPPKDRQTEHGHGPTTSSAFAAATAKWLPFEDGVAAMTATETGSPPLAVLVGEDEEGTAPLHADFFVYCTPHAAEEGETDDAEQHGRRLPALPLPYLKLQRRTQVGQLREVLAGALLELEEEGKGLEGPEGLEILCQGEVLMAQHSLHFVERTRWRDRKMAPPLRLHYRRRQRR